VRFVGLRSWDRITGVDRELETDHLVQTAGRWVAGCQSTFRDPRLDRPTATETHQIDSNIARITLTRHSGPIRAGMYSTVFTIRDWECGHNVDGKSPSPSHATRHTSMSSLLLYEHEVVHGGMSLRSILCFSPHRTVRQTSMACRIFHPLSMSSLPALLRRLRYLWLVFVSQNPRMCTTPPDTYLVNELDFDLINLARAWPQFGICHLASHGSGVSWLWYLAW